MYKSNLAFIKKYFPDIYKVLINEELLNSNKISIIEARSGNPSLSINMGDDTLLIHSKYNPIREAEEFIQTFTKTDLNNKHVIFYGVGLGYHVNEYLRNFNPKSFSFYEPCVEVLEKFLSYNNFPSLNNLDDIYLETNNTGESTWLNVKKIINKFGGDIILVILPSYERIFADKLKMFEEYLSKEISNKKTEIIINNAYEKRWLINVMKNFHEILKTPNFMIDTNDLFLDDKPSIIVSAGPSLAEEIDNLKLIKKNKLAYIFCVGSSINTLLEEDILPDFICTYDPSEKNRLVFEDLVKRKNFDIPLIFGSTVGYEVLEQLEGIKQHILISQDTISPFYLKPKNELNNAKDIYIYDAPSIAVIILQLLLRKSSHPVILVGQNLAYKNALRYSKGINYKHISSKLSEEELNNAIEVESVSGKNILTNKDLIKMKENMEIWIKKSQKIVINTTIDGAKIEGTEFMVLSDVIKTILTKKMVKNCIKETVDQRTLPYDYTYLHAAHKKMNDSLIEFKKLKNDFKKKIKYANYISNYDKQLIAIDKLTEKISNCSFFKVFLKPLMRNFMSKTNSELRIEKYNNNSRERFVKLINIFSFLLEKIEENFEFILPFFDDFNNNIDLFLKRNNMKTIKNH